MLFDTPLLISAFPPTETWLIVIGAEFVAVILFTPPPVIERLTMLLDGEPVVVVPMLSNREEIDATAWAPIAWPEMVLATPLLIVALPLIGMLATTVPVAVFTAV